MTTVQNKVIESVILLVVKKKQGLLVMFVRLLHRLSSLLAPVKGKLEKGKPEVMSLSETFLSPPNGDHKIKSALSCLVCLMASCVQSRECFQTAAGWPSMMVWEAKTECQHGWRNAARCRLTKVFQLPWIQPAFEAIKAGLWQFGHVSFSPHRGEEGNERAR